MKEYIVFQMIKIFWDDLILQHLIQVEEALAMRLEAGLKAWTECLKKKANGKDDTTDQSMDTDAPQQAHKPGGEPQIKVLFVKKQLICSLGIIH